MDTKGIYKDNDSPQPYLNIQEGEETVSNGNLTVVESLGTT